MPKKQKLNGFMLFTMEWKNKQKKSYSLSEATEETGKLWGSMTAEEREPYNDRAKSVRNLPGSGPSKQPVKLACTGKPIEQVEREQQNAEQRERQMKRDVETVVRNSVKNDQLETQSYFFIMANYFMKTPKQSYLPAEISVAEYSLKDGVFRKYHSFINPGHSTYGREHDANEHSEKTHKLPPPPNAKGETNLGLIYNHILDFTRDPNTGEYPPVYTHYDTIPIVESVLDYLKTECGNNIELKVSSIQYLFYILKEATCEMGEVEKPTSHYITDAYFERDFFEYQTGIACTYHEEIDKSKYCTQSCVTRWGFMFSDYMCRDIAIDLIPGRHVPESTNLAAIINPAPSTYGGDTESHISVNSESTYATKPISENKLYYDNQKTYLSARSNTTAGSLTNYNNADDFPKLSSSAASRKKPTPLYDSRVPPKTTRLNTGYDRTMDEDDGGDSDLNPWSFRSRNVPREPDTSFFDINYTREERSDRDSSVVGYGRGRPRMNQSIGSNTTAGSGRGNLLRHMD
ncbi:protein maelstrom 1 [Eurosta solidaginis]|uniref:protein maelstrom 1 n=1 Tax=Eurosta solidaginis TaxID=178769 RepID=UPI00353064D7